MSRKYVLKTPRFQPYKNIDFLVKICTKCGEHKQLNLYKPLAIVPKN